MFDFVGATGDAVRISAEFLTDGHRHRVLQVRPSDLQDSVKIVCLFRERSCEVAR